MEMWSGKPTYYFNIKVSSSLPFAFVRQDKLKARAMKCIFIGYLHGVKGYKLWKLDPDD